MKLSLLSAVVTSAALVGVSAVPLRVVMVTSSSPVDVSIPPGAAIRYGLAAAGAVPNSHMRPDGISFDYSEVSQINNGKMMEGGKHRRPCGASRFRQKAVEISNAFRTALGLPLIEAHPEAQHHRHHHHHHGDPEQDSRVTMVHGSVVRPIENVSNMPHPHHGRPIRPMFSHFRESTFMMRLHQALMDLGPWEGRAMAFVIGCGIGSLLRMIFVLFVVTFRAFKGPSSSDSTPHVTYVEVYDEDAEEIAPPQYLDEKAPIAPTPEESK